MDNPSSNPIQKTNAAANPTNPTVTEYKVLFEHKNTKRMVKAAKPGKCSPHSTISAVTETDDMCFVGEEMEREVAYPDLLKKLDVRAKTRHTMCSSKHQWLVPQN